MEPGLIENGTFDGGQRTFPNGCHISDDGGGDCNDNCEVNGDD